jgi:hypothetical protein
MDKIKIYISSRSNTKSIGLDKDILLSDLRLHIREKLEEESFLEEEMLEVLIHENNFAPDTAQDPHTLSLSKMEECNIVFILYNGDSGWNPAFDANGICHDEFTKAVDEFSKMTHIIDISENFPCVAPQEKDLEFQKSVNQKTREVIPQQATVVALFEKVLNQIKYQILNDIHKSIATQKDLVRRSNVYGETLDLAKMTYNNRIKHLKKELEDKAQTLFPGLIISYDVIPDNMSVSDARNRIGRPFLRETEIIKQSDLKSGVIHIIAVYGNCTEIQIKNLVGFPDLTVVKDEFGFYLWDNTNHIQMIFLSKCINTNTIGSKINSLHQWLINSREYDDVMNRAEARYSILSAINDSKKFL